MKSSCILFFIFLASVTVAKENIYLIPGHGSDYRIYNELQLDPELYDTIHVPFLVPYKNELMTEYVKRMSAAIDTGKMFSLVGVSLGGMVAVELSRILHPRKVIIISSASCREELPLRYRMMERAPFYKIFSGGFYKSMAKTAQLIWEPDRKKEAEVFDKMLKEKDKVFLKRAIHLMVTWHGEKPDPSCVVHIHGKSDHTIPIRNVDSHYAIEKGSHMMALTRSEEISRVITEILEK